MTEERMNVRGNNTHRLGIVIPCYNEGDIFECLVKELVRFAEGCSYSVRVLFVDDGSTDDTYSRMAEISGRDERFAALRLSRNFGHQLALSAGYRFVQGDVVATLDADLQDPPEVLNDFLLKWEEGFEVVYGIRTERKENVLLRACYAFFYRLLKKLSHVEIPLDAGDFCVMDRKVVDLINSMPEHNRFIRGMRGWVGLKQIGIRYERKARVGGQPKYTLRKLMQLALDGLFSFSSIPLRIASWVGAMSALLSLILFAHVIYSKLFKAGTPTGWASTVAIVIFFGGIQLLVLGVIGEYISRMYDETKRRPLFIVSEATGWVGKDRGL